MTGDVLIHGGRLIDPSQNIDIIQDLLIRSGRVYAVCGRLDADVAEVFDASGMLVMPGLIDMHTHLREPGEEESETMGSGCEAAAAGGFTTVCAMPNTNPPTDDAGRVRYILERAEGLKARVYPIGAITRGRAGRELVEMQEMVNAGAVGFSDDGVSIMDAALMRNALRYSQMTGKPIIAHEEDANLDRDGQMNEGALSAELGLRGMPSIAEEVMVLRDIAIAEYLGARIHITHVSTSGTVAVIREAKARGVKVTCDVTPHHLTLAEDLVAAFDTRYKMNPPLRIPLDIAALHKGLSDGTVDAIATDHAPHYIERKEVEFIDAAFGVTGLETALGVIHRELVDTGILSWSDVVRTMSCVPAAILGIEGGTLKTGAPGDVTIYNPDAPWTVNPRAMKSKSSNTPFSGWELPGRVEATVVGGVVYYHNKL